MIVCASLLKFVVSRSRVARISLPGVLRRQDLCCNPRVRQPSRPPEQVVAEAKEEVLKLEAAVRALGGESSVNAKPLVEALKEARVKS